MSEMIENKRRVWVDFNAKEDKKQHTMFEIIKSTCSTPRRRRSVAHRVNSSSLGMRQMELKSTPNGRYKAATTTSPVAPAA